jgi:hypothetical protein
MVHGKAPNGTRPRPVQLTPCAGVDWSSRRHHGQSQAGSDPKRRVLLLILTVLKRSVVLWVKEATK